MKIKMHITNFNAFKRAYYDCEGPVFLLSGKQRVHAPRTGLLITKRSMLLTSHLLDLLLEKYYAQKRYLSIWCSCESISDYYKLLACSAWER